MAMQLQYVKVAHYERDCSCPHNKEVICNAKDCYHCGWNPKVAEIRMEKILQKGKLK